MATFPSIQPLRRSYDFPEFPMEEEAAWPGVGVRYRTGYDPLAAHGVVLRLAYQDINSTQMQQIRTHYAMQQGGTVDFNIPSVIFQGNTSGITPALARWRYLATPEETHKSAGLFDVTIELESMPFLATEPAPPPPPPITATYSQRSIWPDNTAATAEGMTNGITAETTETGTNDHYDADGAWLQMDFGSQTAFSKVVVGCDFDNTLAGGWGQFYTEDCDIIGSNNASTWTVLANTGEFTQALQEYVTTGASYRYVRIRKADDYLAVTEFYALP
jgi:hypothetical protein